MKNFIRIIIFSFFTLLPTFALAQEGSQQLFRIRYIIKPGESFADVYRQFVYDNAIVNRNTPMVQATMRRNPEVEDWENLPEGQMINLFVSPEALDQEKFQAYRQEMIERIEQVQEEIEKSESESGRQFSIYPEGWRSSVHFMMSQGRFTQKNEEIADLDFNQNSPFTLGADLSYYFKDTNWSVVSHIRYAHMTAASNNLDTSYVDIDPEISIGLHTQYRLQNQGLNVHFGIDYEKFSTFNLPGIQMDRLIYLDKNTVTYATLGVSRFANIFGRGIFTKLGISRSVASELTPGKYPYPSGDSNYSGQKVEFFFNGNVIGRFYLHGLLKYRWMDGPSELNTLRLGLGVGYILF